jgi:colanic acid biosynthesis glycosyl transferase WcaI
LARIRPVEAADLRREAGIEPDAFVVQYAGNFGRSQDLEAILDAARLVEVTTRGAAMHTASGPDVPPGTIPPIRFLLVGGGAREDAVRARARDVPNVRLLPYQSEERVPEVLSAADVALVPLQRGLARFSVPSKIYSILASGRAVGAAIDAGSEVARIVEEAECGFRVEPGDARALAEEILCLAADRGRAARCGRNARSWSERRGGLDRAATAYESLLTRVAACR